MVVLLELLHIELESPEDLSGYEENRVRQIDIRKNSYNFGETALV